MSDEESDFSDDELEFDEEEERTTTDYEDVGKIQPKDGHMVDGTIKRSKKKKAKEKSYRKT